jgi:hypothetical protein
MISKYDFNLTKELMLG